MLSSYFLVSFRAGATGISIKILLYFTNYLTNLCKKQMSKENKRKSNIITIPAIYSKLIKQPAIPLIYIQNEANKTYEPV